MEKIIVYEGDKDDLGNPIYKLFRYHSDVHTEKIIFDYVDDITEKDIIGVINYPENIYDVKLYQEHPEEVS